MRRYAKLKWRRWMRTLLRTGDSAERTSFAFALGVFIACLPPVPWFHTAIALLIAFLFRLNRLAIVIGTLINTPLTIAPLVVFEIYVGLKILGRPAMFDLPLSQLHTLEGWTNAVNGLLPFVAPLIVGSVVIASIASVAAYAACLRVLRRLRRRRILAGQRAHAEIEMEQGPERAGGLPAPAAAGGGEPGSLHP